MNRFLKSQTAKIFLVFLIWRILLFLIAFSSSRVIAQFGGKFPYFQEELIASGLPFFIWSFGNFDGVYYLHIAQNAYSSQYTQAFFPLYPILIRLVSFVTFGNLIIAALLVSNVSFFIGLLVFNKLIREIYNQNIAFWSCLFLLTFPTSFYFGAIYTESLFFLIIISAFYFSHKKRFLIASIIGSFASATRLVGLFLAPALISRKNIKSLFPLVVVPLGFLAYVIYLKIEFNNPLYFLSAQQVFGQERATNEIIFLPQVIYRYIKILITTTGLPLVNAVFELFSALFALLLLFLSYKKVRPEWLIFSAFAVLTPTLTGTFISMPRYILIAFPIYIFLGSLERFKIKILILLYSFILLFICMTLFAQGYWVA